MNCKPGDLAIVIARCPNRDKLLRVLDSENCEPGEWRCETLQRFHAFEWDVNKGIVPAGHTVWADDCAIRPIGNPGDDAVDETLRELEAA